MAARMNLSGGAILAALGALWSGLSSWTTFVSFFPESARPYVQSPFAGIVMSLVAISLLWKAAAHSFGIEKDISRAIKLAEQTNADLARRVEAAEARLVATLDDRVISWAPAYQKLQDDAREEMQRTLQGHQQTLRDSFMSYRRLADRGYGPDDDISKPPTLQAG